MTVVIVLCLNFCVQIIPACKQEEFIPDEFSGSNAHRPSCIIGEGVASNDKNSIKLVPETYEMQILSEDATIYQGRLNNTFGTGASYTRTKL